MTSASPARESLQARMFEDLENGERFETATAFLDGESMRRFAADWDPQPIHLDEQAARDSMLGVLMASGWHVLCASMRLIIDAAPLGATPLLGMGVENIRFHRPVLPNTEIRVRGEFRDKRPSASRPDRGYILLHTEPLDAASGELLISQDCRLVLPARGGA